MKDCCSLEIAKKLKEAGWKQPSKFKWMVDDPNPPWTGAFLTEAQDSAYPDRAVYPAPTIGELLEALPDRTELIRNDFNGTDDHWFAQWDDQCWKATSPADALALLWLALKEKGLI